MKITRNSIGGRLWVFSALIGLASCGGGGGGSGTAQTSYTGLTTPAVLAADGVNANSAISDYMDMDTILRTEISSTTFAAPVVSSGPLKVTIQTIFTNPLKTQASKRTPAEVVTYPIACDTGTGSTKFDGNPTTMIGVQTITYSKCSMSGLLLDGSVVMEGLEYSNSNYTNLRITYNIKTTSYGKSAITVGTLTQKYTNGHVSQGSMDMLIQRDNPNGGQVYYKNIQLADGVITGELYRDTLGYVTINTLVPLDINHVDGNNKSAPLGNITLTGKDNSLVNMLIESAALNGSTSDTYLRWALTLHTPGNAADKYSWKNHDGSNIPDVNPQEPLIAFRYAQYQNQINTPVTLDASYTSDANDDFVQFSWALLSKPEDSQLSITDSKGPLQTLTPDVSGHYVFQLTAQDNDHVVVKTVSLDSYFSATLDDTVIDAGITKRLAFDEKHQRILTLTTITGVTNLKAIDLSTGQISFIPLPQAPANAYALHVSANGDYLALANYQIVVLLNADNLSLLGTFDTSSLMTSYGSIQDLKVSNTGKVYCAYKGPINNLNQNAIGVVDIDMSALPATAQTFTWGNSGDSFTGDQAEIIAMDNATQRLIVSNSSNELRSASTITHQQLGYVAEDSHILYIPEQPGGLGLYQSWYLPNLQMVVTQHGVILDAETLNVQGNFAGGSYVGPIVAHGNGAIGFGSTSFMSTYTLQLVSTIDQAPTIWQAPWDIFEWPGLVPTKNQVDPVIMYSSNDQKHEYWIAQQYVPVAPGSNNGKYITKFVRH